MDESHAPHERRAATLTELMLEVDCGGGYYVHSVRTRGERICYFFTDNTCNN